MLRATAAACLVLATQLAAGDAACTASQLEATMEKCDTSSSFSASAAYAADEETTCAEAQVAMQCYGDCCGEILASVKEELAAVTEEEDLCPKLACPPVSRSVEPSDSTGTDAGAASGNSSGDGAIGMLANAAPHALLSLPALAAVAASAWYGR